MGLQMTLTWFEEFWKVDTLDRSLEARECGKMYCWGERVPDIYNSFYKKSAASTSRVWFEQFMGMPPGFIDGTKIKEVRELEVYQPEYHFVTVDQICLVPLF